MIRLLLLVLLLCPLFLSGQSKWETGLWGGGGFYRGDLTPSISGTLKGIRPAYGLFLRRELGANFALKASAFRGQLSGDDANYSRFSGRALSFSTNITEASLLLEWRLFSPSQAGSRLTPYFFSGGGLLQMAPRPEFFNQPSGPPPPGVKEDIQAEYTRSRFTLPFGFGMEYLLNENWAIGAEAGMRTSFSDYLDGISFSGNPNKNDWYGFAGLSLSYRWGAHDQDGDGINDAQDRCPGHAGSAIHDGCPDSDGDGFDDTRDNCPLLAGALQGCPDSDGDGVADHVDRCPQQPGPLFRAGCPSEDSDGDGVPDEEDRCPQQIGPPARQGCPLLDSDQDGIDDERDQCPLTAGSSANFGCPEAVGETEASYRLFFAPQSTRLDDSKKILLNALATALSRQPSVILMINGHADEQGPAEANRQLSLRRARACYDYLLQQGARPGQMHYQGHGDTYPLAPHTGETGRQLNRRVELELQLQ